MSIDYMTRADFARHAGLALQTIKRYRTSGTLPEPDLYVENKPLWSRETVEQWTRAREAPAT